MLSKRHRISSALFPLVSKGKRTVYGPFFVVSSERPDLGTSPKVAVICSKKVAKTAVLRNALRREIYTNTASWAAETKRPLHCLFFLNKSYVDSPHETRTALIKKALANIVL